MFDFQRKTTFNMLYWLKPTFAQKG